MSSRTSRPGPVRTRRKRACDLCFTKRIKCDSRQPRCSNCALYQSDCRRTASRRKASPPVRSQRELESTTTPGQGDVGTVEASPLRPASGQVTITTSTPTCQTRDESLWTFDAISPTLYHGAPDKLLELPALEELMPMIDVYFEHVNPYMPLFDQSTFMKLVTRWFGHNPRPDTASWASILVVVGLGSHAIKPAESATTQNPRCWTDYCMRNAQSVISELSMRDDDITGVQVLVALAMLFRSALDIRPSSILLGMAVRLAHQMHLQSSGSAQYFTADEALERSNVFWVLYTLDKDICLKTKTPYLLSDGDITIPRPTATPSTCPNSTHSDTTTALQIFHQRLNLAYIESQVYDLLYSSSAQSIPATERHNRVHTLQALLTNWQDSLPPSLDLPTTTATMPPPLPPLPTLHHTTSLLHHLTALHHVRLAALVSTHGIYSRLAPWSSPSARYLTPLGRASLDDFAAATYGPRVTTCIQAQHGPSPAAWARCVAASRACARLFRQAASLAAGVTEPLLWQNLCAHFSGLIVLLANVVLLGSTGAGGVQGEARRDIELVEASVGVYDRRFEGTGGARAYDALRRLVEELRKNAVKILAEGPSEQNVVGSSTSTADVETGLDMYHDPMLSGAGGNEEQPYDICPGDMIDDFLVEEQLALLT